MQLKRLLPLTSVGLALATGRPSDVSICDYYTTALLKEDTPANQYTLLTLLVNTVVIGNYTQPNVGITVPGILAPAVYNGEDVNLLQYFDGCLLSTNVNNVPSSVNFLDGGGAAPLLKNMPANSPNSNQFGLLTHLYQFFGILLGCSGVGEMGFPAYGGDPSMYDVHKYMSLDPNEIGYFISQVGAAAASFGVASSDITIVAGALMKYFGYRCTPPETIVSGPQLDSICVDPACPLDPMADCHLYPWWGVSPSPKTASQCMSAGTTPTAAPPASTSCEYWKSAW